MPAAHCPIREFRPQRPLTPAQARLLPYLAEALSYAEIAAALGCAPRTVRVHAHALADKLPGCGDPYLRAVRYAIIIAVEAACAAQRARERAA
jgi:DNA-binding NarL/FixJ family response regulator